jgi:cell pole-organizing protein PopZ
VLALDPSMLVEEPPSLPVTTAQLAEPPPLPPVASAPPPAPKPPAAPPALPAPELEAAKPVPVEPPPPAAAAPPIGQVPSLLGDAASAAAISSVGSLLRTLAAERQNLSVYRGGPTLEDLAREEMRPLLKQWLDSNLPAIVERLVRAEIERVVGRAVS